jgi:hypothetical protein
MSRRFNFFVMGGAALVILGLLAAAQLAVKKPKSKFAELFRPAQIMELDLRLLELRISTLEEHPRNRVARGPYLLRSLLV